MMFQNFETAQWNFEEAEKTDDDTSNAVIMVKKRKYDCRPSAFFTKRIQQNQI